MPQAKPVRRSNPFVSVDDVRQGALPEASELAAGSDGLGREVVWCAVLRARAPAFQSSSRVNGYWASSAKTGERLTAIA